MSPVTTSVAAPVTAPVVAPVTAPAAMFITVSVLVPEAAIVTASVTAQVTIPNYLLLPFQSNIIALFVEFASLPSTSTTLSFSIWKDSMYLSYFGKNFMISQNKAFNLLQ